MRVRYSFSSRHTGNIENITKQRKKFPKVALDVINISDIILEVLDARFPQETRNLEVEEIIKEQNKKIIYVLNKSDLVNVKETRKEINKLNLYPHVFVSSKQRKGSRELRNRIKIEIKKIKTNFERAQVGIIGYPNTGKSSLINFLTGKTSAKTASEAGFTKGMQKLSLSKDILIIDTPGVIPNEKYSQEIRETTQHAKVGARDYNKIKEPDFVIAELMKNYSKQIQDFYNIDADNDSEILIEQLGRKKNFIKKHNQIDIDRTARLVLRDWQEGNIRI